jgi:hypothetical protein
VSELVALDIEFRHRPKAVVAQDIAVVAPPEERGDQLADVGVLVALLDLDQDRRHAAAQKRVGARKHGALVALDVALDERHAGIAQLGHVVEPPDGHANGPVLHAAAGRGQLQARERVRRAAPDDRHVQHGLALGVGEPDRVDGHVVACDPGQAAGVDRPGLEGVDMTRVSDKPAQPE